MRRAGPRKRKRRALSSCSPFALLAQRHPHVALGLRRLSGGWWTTRGGAWAKSAVTQRRRRIAHVAASEIAAQYERDYRALLSCDE